jgi:DNA-binding response OmpR family regulator
MHIAIVEDESKLRQTLREGLEPEHYTVDTFSTGESFEHKLEEKKSSYELIVLDLMLPGKSGLEICRDLRKKGITTPILVLTARSTVADKVELFDAGADDFVTKPFSFEELLARFRVLLRRPQYLKKEIVSLGNLSLDGNTRMASYSGKSLALTTTEYDLLWLLIEYQGQVVSREKIANYLWNLGTDSIGNLVEVHISNLRKKIRYEHDQELIHTIRSVGYMVKE